MAAVDEGQHGGVGAAALGAIAGYQKHGVGQGRAGSRGIFGMGRAEHHTKI